jgi:hypothetical protein
MKLLLNTALAKLVAIVKEGYYEELIELVKTDANFRESLLEIEKLVNWKYAYTTHSFDEEFLFSLKDYELVVLIRAFTALDGAIDKFTFGSDTPVQCLFHRLEDFGYDKNEELIDWIFRNRKNNYILPFGWDSQREVKSLFEYRLVDQVQQAKRYAERQQNNLRSIQKRVENKDRNTDSLRNAIKRKDWKSFDSLIKKGADLYAPDGDGGTLAEKIEAIKTDELSNNSSSILQLEESFYPSDGNKKQVAIKIRDFPLIQAELKKVNCVSLSAGYGDDFGCNQLDRFVDDKESLVIKDYCDLAIEENKAKLLPSEVSSKWRVIVTPALRANTYIEIQDCQLIMEEIFELSKSTGTESINLLISQYKNINEYREQQFAGVFQAIKSLCNSSLGNLDLIYFEVDTRHKEKFYKQLRSHFYN